jgi:surface polysaccharide O-acyltransferase-like enzyme
MKLNERLIGIDLFRGIAIFSVVLLHSDQGVANPPWVWNRITEFSGFAVPFFLATSFYFSVMKIKMSPDKFDLKKRIMRLLPPYLIWTGVYILYKVFKYTIDSNIEQLKNIFHDPIALIFFGSSSIQMYFLPLLITGTFTLILVKFLIKTNLRLRALIILQILSLIIYEVILRSGNSVQNYYAFQPLLNSISPNLADDQIIRIFAVFLAWTFLCLPYLLTAMIVNHLLASEAFFKSQFLNSKKFFLILMTVFVIVNLVSTKDTDWGTSSLGSTYAVARGFISLLVAIFLSARLHSKDLIKNLSFCSFGIYLSHMIFVEFLMILDNRLYSEASLRNTTMGLMLFASCSFFLSWTATYFLTQNKQLSKLLFG